MKILVIVLMIPITYLITGVVVQDLWKWFIVPLNVTPINFWHALGISLIVNTMTYHLTEIAGDAKTRWAVSTFGVPAKWLLAWGIGSLISLGMV